MLRTFPDSARLEFAGTTHVRWKKRRLLYFGGCDYLRLSHHARVHRALREGLRRFGLNVSASRLTTGNHPLYSQLERALETFFGAPAACLAPTGYSSNLVVAQAMAGQFTHAILDAHAHASLRDASCFLNCDVSTFQPRTPEALRRAARRCGARARIVLLTDGMFAYDGSVAPLQAYRSVLPASAWLLVDDAHGAGVVGITGRGSLEHEQLGFDRVIQTITLSKAFGSYGGAVLSNASVKSRIVQHSRLFAGSTPVPLPVIFASLTALELHRANPQWLESVRVQTSRMRAVLRAAGLDAPDRPGPVISFAPRRARALGLQRALLAADIYPSFLHYPGGPAHGYFRFALSPAHRRADLDRLVKVLVENLAD